MERVDIRQTGKGLDGSGEALSKGLGSVLYFSRVEGSNSANLETCTNLRRKPGVSVSFRVLGCVWVRRRANCAGVKEFCILPPLGPGEHNIQELLARRHGGNILPLRLHFGRL